MTGSRFFVARLSTCPDVQIAAGHVVTKALIGLLGLAAVWFVKRGSLVFTSKYDPFADLILACASLRSRISGGSGSFQRLTGGGRRPVLHWKSSTSSAW